MSSACPSSRMGHVAAVINDEMLVWGGAAVRESTGDLFYCSPELIECFNLLTSQWYERLATSNSPLASDLPHPCLNARICVVQNRDIYQFGGQHSSSDGREVYLNDVHKLDGSTLEWQRISIHDQSTPSGRSGHGMCVLGKKGDEHLVIMGGRGATILSPIPDGSQFLPSSKYPDEGWNNEVWLFCIRKMNWIPAQCTGKKPLPRLGHSFTSVNFNRAILFGGCGLGQAFADAFLFMFGSLEWIEMKLDDPLIPRFDHSMVVVDIPILGGPVAFLLWGYGKDGYPLSLAQMLLIDFQKCKKISISSEPIPTGQQSVCSIVRRGLLFILRYGGSPYKATEPKPEALLDILQYDSKNVMRLNGHDSNEPIEQGTSKYDKIAPFRSNSPTMNCEGLSQKERELLHPSPKRVGDVIAVVTPQSVLIFTRWKTFASQVSLDKGAEISIPNTESILRIHPRTALSPTPKMSMSLTLFTFDAKQSQGLLDDEFVSDLIQLSLPSGLSDDDVHIEMCHEHGLNLDPMTPKTSASKVVFFYQPHDHLGTTQHPIKFDEKIVIVRAGQRKIAAVLQSSVVKVIVSPSSPAAAASAVAVASSNDDVSCSFFTHFYGLGQQAFSFHALSFERIKFSNVWQFDLCLISTRPEHRDRFLAYRYDGRGQPLLFDRRVKNLLLSPTQSNVVDAGDVEGWINESRRKKYFIDMQQLLAVRDSPIDAWVDTFYFASSRRGLLVLPLPRMNAYVTIESGDRRQCLRVQCSAFSNICEHVELQDFKRGRLEPSREMAHQYNNPSHLEMEKLTFVMRSQWIDVARIIFPYLTDSEIAKIQLHERENQALRFLEAWIDKYDLSATRESLVSALIKVGLASSAEEIFPKIYEKITKEVVLNPSLQVHLSELDYDEEKDFLGCGACGDVFKATLKKSGKPEKTVAVKVFKEFSKRRKKEKEYKMFKKEAAIILRIDPNPFILGLIGLCAVPTFYALVTEFVSGGNLFSLLQSDEHKAEVEKWETRVKFAKQIADGMFYLHSNQPPVIHYDLKALNVLVESTLYNDGVQFICKVADFGLSKMCGVSSVTKKQRKGSDPAGTVTHIAPECYSEHPYGDRDDEDIQRDLAKKSDVYSYGVLLWEIRERRHPYEGKDKDEIRFLVKSGEKFPEGQGTGVPPFFDNLMKKSLQFVPQNRPTFREIVVALIESSLVIKHRSGDNVPSEHTNWLLREPLFSDLVSAWHWESSDSTLLLLREKKLISHTHYDHALSCYVANDEKIERCRTLLTELLPTMSGHSFMEFLSVLRATGQTKAWRVLVTSKFETALYVPLERITPAPDAMASLSQSEESSDNFVLQFRGMKLKFTKAQTIEDEVDASGGKLENELFSLTVPPAAILGDRMRIGVTIYECQPEESESVDEHYVTDLIVLHPCGKHFAKEVTISFKMEHVFRPQNHHACILYEEQDAGLFVSSPVRASESRVYGEMTAVLRESSLDVRTNHFCKFCVSLSGCLGHYYRTMAFGRWADQKDLRSRKSTAIDLVFTSSRSSHVDFVEERYRDRPVLFHGRAMIFFPKKCKFTLEVTDCSDDWKVRNSVTSIGKHELEKAKRQASKYCMIDIMLRKAKDDAKEPSLEILLTDGFKTNCKFYLNKYGKPHSSHSWGSSVHHKSFLSESSTNPQEFDRHQVPTDRELLYLSKQIPDRWRFVARYLNVEKSEIASISEQYKWDGREQAYQMLCAWKERQSEAASTNELFKALVEEGLKSTAEKVFSNV